jgi:hypothetical protein
MPLIYNEYRSTNHLWSQSECDIDKEELGWNLRHAALLENDWIDEPKVYDSHGAGFGVITQCKILPDSKQHSGVYSESEYRAVALRLKANQLRVEFEALNKKWCRDTRHLSLISKKVVHPAYLRIIGMGEAAIPLLLEALRDRPTHWFAALRATANTDPCPIDANPSQARDAWLSWGRLQGYID